MSHKSLIILISLSILVAILGSTACATINMGNDNEEKANTVVEPPDQLAPVGRLEGDGATAFITIWNDKLAAKLIIDWKNNKPYTCTITTDDGCKLGVVAQIENMSGDPQAYTRWAASDPSIYLWLISPDNQRFPLHSNSNQQNMFPVVVVEDLGPQEILVEEKMINDSSPHSHQSKLPGIYELRMEFFPGKETAIPDKPEIVLSTTIELIK